MTLTVRSYTLAPTGIEYPDPSHEHDRRILNRIFSGRIKEARMLRARHYSSETTQTPWGQFTEATFAWVEEDFLKAAQLARQCAATALQAGLAEPTEPVAIRLAASAMEIEGCSLRRCEQYDSAERIHRVAYELRHEYGRGAEQVESAISLGTCRQWAGDLAYAQQWLRRAADLPPDSPACARQSAWANVRLSMLLSEQAHHDDAIQAARKAHEILRAYFPGQHFAWVANLHLTEAMIRQVEVNFEHHDASNSFMLIGEILTQNRKELEAFGACVANDLDWCDQQLDFLLRLQASMA